MTATELELLGCFGVEPRLRDADIPWFYNSASYHLEVDDLSVSFVVAPGYRDVRRTVRRGEVRLFEFDAICVRDVRVIDQQGVDAVEVILTEACWIRLQLRPTIEIIQGFEDEIQASGRGVRSRTALMTHPPT
jgi:hypothetical protein